jgi:hypothetical protein
MKKFLLVVFMVLIMAFFTTGANAEYKFAENWTWTDTAYQSVFLGLTYVDWKQTHWMASHNWQWDGGYYREQNPFLGDFPDSGKVDKLIPLGMVLHTLVAMAIPPRSCTEEQEKNGRININFRRIWQCLFIVVESAAVYNNYTLGVQFELP